MEKGSLEAFLASPEQRKKYYLALGQWLKFDDQAFTLENFNAALDQIQTFSQKVPNLYSRLMETQGLGTRFQVTSVEVRQLNAAAWTRFREQWLETLRQSAGAIDSPEKVKRIYEPVEKAIADAEALSKNGKKNALSSFFEKLRADPARMAEIKAANAFLILQRLGQGDLRARLESTDPAVALAALAELGRGGPPFPTGAQSLLAGQLPSRDEILGNEEIFPYADKRLGEREVTYDFVPLMRRFHGLWKGLRVGECVGGGCRGWAEHTNLRRLLTVALAGTEHYLIENNGRHLGWTEHIPMKRKTDGSVYATTEYGSEVFGKKVTLVRDGKPVTVSFAEAWWAEYRKVMPKGWRGITKSDAFTTNNNGVLPPILETLAWRMGTQLGQGLTDFSYEGSSLAEAITHAPLTPTILAMYGGEIYFDATVPTAGALTLVEDFDPRQFESLAYYQQKLAAAGPEMKEWLLSQWVQLAPDRPDIRKFLLRAILALTPHEIDVFDSHVKNDIRKGIFKSSPLLALRYKSDADLARLFENDAEANAQKKAIARSAAEAFAYFRSRRVAFNVLQPLFHNVEDADLLAEEVRHYAQEGRVSPAIYVKIFAAIVKSKYRQAILKSVAAATVEHFFRGKPSEADIKALYKAQDDIAPLIDFRKKRQELHRAGTLVFRNAREMLVAIGPERESRSDPYRKDLSNLHADFADDFLRLHPSNEEFLTYLGNSDYIHARKALREKRLQLHLTDPAYRLRSAAEFLALMSQELKDANDEYKKAHGELLEKHLQTFIDLRPSASEFQAGVSQQTSIRAAIQLRRLRMNLHRSGAWPFRDAADMLAYLKMNTSNPTDEYREWFSKFIAEFAEDFFKLHPTAKEQKEYLSQSTFVNPSLAIRKTRLGLHQSDPAFRFKSAREYLELMAMESKNPSEAYVKELKALHESTADVFIALHPGPREWAAFLKASPDSVPSRIDLRRRRLRSPGSGKDGALTAADYLDVLVLEHGYSNEYRIALGEFGREILDGFRKTQPTSAQWERFAAFAASFSDGTLEKWAKDRAAEVKVATPAIRRIACWFGALAPRLLRRAEPPVAYR